MRRQNYAGQSMLSMALEDRAGRDAAISTARMATDKMAQANAELAEVKAQLADARNALRLWLAINDRINWLEVPRDLREAWRTARSASENVLERGE